MAFPLPSLLRPQAFRVLAYVVRDFFPDHYTSPSGKKKDLSNRVLVSMCTACAVSPHHLREGLVACSSVRWVRWCAGFDGVFAGTGFFTDSRWRVHSGGTNSALLGPATRLLAVDAARKVVSGTLSGRVGVVVSSDPFTGGIFNTTLPDDAGWGPAHLVADPSAAGLAGPLRAFAL